MKIAVDIDGCITEYPAVFAQLLEGMVPLARHRVYILTNREPGTEKEIANELAGYGIKPHMYAQIVITPDKADFIIKNGITLFFENTDEYFQKLPPSVCVMKVREDGNFNYETGKWIYGNKTGESID